MKKLLVIIGTIVLLGYAVIVGLNRRPPPQPKAKPFAFQKAAIALPADTSTLPAGPNVDVVTAACTSCHSPAMITMQPRLTADQWTATIKKMREVYKAPIADADTPKILAYLNAQSSAVAE